MTQSRLLPVAALTAAATAVLAVALPSTATAHRTSLRQGVVVSDAPFGAAQQLGIPGGLLRQGPFVGDAPSGGVRLGPTSSDRRHGGGEGHLPATSQNVELLAKLSPTAPFGDILPGQIADLAMFGGWAYLNSWRDDACERGGVYVVDARDPREPREAGFVPALEGNYHGEGAQVVKLRTESFSGDVLAVNNEYCADVPAAAASTSTT